MIRKIRGIVTMICEFVSGCVIENDTAAGGKLLHPGRYLESFQTQTVRQERITAPQFHPPYDTDTNVSWKMLQ